MIRNILLLLAAGLMLSACDKIPQSIGQPGAAKAAGSGVAVLDLGAVAKALGRDEVFRQQMESARQQLGQQLTDFSTGLQGQLREEQAKLGEAPTTEQQQELRQKVAQAQRQVQQSRVLARRKAAEFQTNLAVAFRNEVQPIAAEIAREKGASAVVLSNTLLWFEPVADITGEVIDKMRAKGAAAPAEPKTESEKPAG